MDSPPWTRAISAVLFDLHARKFLLRAKISGRRELLGPLGRQLAVAIRGTRIDQGCDSIMPIPSHPWANLRRGFQPATELASEVSRLLGIRLQSKGLRVRLKSRLYAKHLSAIERKQARLNAFVARRLSVGARILLIDDVMTTGSTAQGCAEALVKAGAGEVRVAVWARTPRFVDHRDGEG